MGNEAVLQIKLEALDRASVVAKTVSKEMGGLVNQIEEYNKRIQNGGRVIQQWALALSAVVSFNALKGMVRDAQDAELANAKLGKALGNVGKFSVETFEDLKNYASALEDVTGVSEEMSKQVMATLLRFGAEGKTLKELTALTLDYAAARNMSPESAADTIGKALAGRTTELERQGIVLAKNKDRAAALIETLRSNVGGSAEADYNALGPIEKVERMVGNLKKELGLALLPVIEEFAIGFLEGLDAVKSGINDLKNAFDGLDSSTKNILQTLGRWAAEVSPVAIVIGSVVTSLWLVATAIGQIIALTRTVVFTLKLLTGEAMSIGSALVANVTKVPTSLAGVARGVASATMIIAAGFEAWDLGTRFGTWLGQVEIGGRTVVEHLANVITYIGEYFDKIIAAIRVAWANMVNEMKSSLSSFGSMAKSFASSALTSTSPTLGTLATMAGMFSDNKANENSSSLDNEFKTIEEKYAKMRSGIDRISENRKNRDPLDDEADAYIAAMKKREALEKRLKERGAYQNNPNWKAPDLSNDGGRADKDLTQELSRLQQEYNTKLENTNLLRQLGRISASQAEEQTKQATEQYTQQLEALIAKLKERYALAQQNNDTQAMREFGAAINEATNAMLQLEAAQQSQSFMGQFTSTLEDAARSALNLGKNLGGVVSNAVSGLGNAFGQVAVGAQSFGAAMQQLAQSVVSAFISMIVQALAWLAIVQLLNLIPGGSAVLGFMDGMGKLGLAGGGVVKAATGRYISEGTTSTADDVPAMLSKGEYVVKASTVRKYGVGFMERFNAGLISAATQPLTPVLSVPAFADGGLVGDGGLAGMLSGKSDTIFNIGIYGTEKQALAAMKKAQGKKIIIDTAKRHKREIS